MIPIRVSKKPLKLPWNCGLPPAANYSGSLRRVCLAFASEGLISGKEGGRALTAMRPPSVLPDFLPRVTGESLNPLMLNFFFIRFFDVFT